MLFAPKKLELLNYSNEISHCPTPLHTQVFLLSLVQLGMCLAKGIVRTLQENRYPMVRPCTSQYCICCYSKFSITLCRTKAMHHTFFFFFFCPYVTTLKFDCARFAANIETL